MRERERTKMWAINAHDSSNSVQRKWITVLENGYEREVNSSMSLLGSACDFFVRLPWNILDIGRYKWYQSITLVYAGTGS